ARRKEPPTTVDQVAPSVKVALALVAPATVGAMVVLSTAFDAYSVWLLVSGTLLMGGGLLFGALARDARDLRMDCTVYLGLVALGAVMTCTVVLSHSFSSYAAATAALVFSLVAT